MYTLNRLKLARHYCTCSTDPILGIDKEISKESGTQKKRKPVTIEVYQKG